MNHQRFSIVCAGGAAAHFDLSRGQFTISRDDKFSALIDNPAQTDNGFTVGQRNRALLHAALEAWIDGLPAEGASDEQCERFVPGSKR